MKKTKETKGFLPERSPFYCTMPTKRLRTRKGLLLFVLVALAMFLPNYGPVAQTLSGGANSAGIPGSGTEPYAGPSLSGSSLSGSSLSGPEHTYRMKKGMAIKGTVVYVADGDTFNLKLDDGVVIIVRAQAIDAPEKGQEHGNISKEFLRREILNRRITVIYDKTDSYNRYVGRIYRNGLDMEELMLRRGHAWHFKRFNNEPLLARSEADARARKIGLWNDPNPEPPEDFRKKKKGGYAPIKIGIPAQEGEKFWISRSGTLHNDSCGNFNNTEKGRFAGPNEGRDCKMCGGSRRNLINDEKK